MERFYFAVAAVSVVVLAAGFLAAVFVFYPKFRGLA